MSEPDWQTLVSPQALAAALTRPRLRLIDARFVLADPAAGRRGYLHSHLPGSAFADLEQDLSGPARRGKGRHPLPEAAQFCRRLGQWGVTPADQVVVYDAGDGSMAAARLWWMLRLLGHRRVAVLDGGLAGWRALGLAETAESPMLRDGGIYPGHFDPVAIVGDEEVAARLGQAPGWLLDARASERFRGEVEPIDRHAGHLPGAINRPLALNLQDGRFRSGAALRGEIAALLGAYAPQQAVLMCGSGVTACHLLLAMELAGLSGARIYAGSWSGWIDDPAHPRVSGD